VAIQDQRPAAAGDAASFDPRHDPGYLLPPPAPVSWDDFLAWRGEDIRAEWVAGEIIEMAPVRNAHQFILIFLTRLIMDLVDRDALGDVLTDPAIMRLPLRPSGRQPDLMFVSAAHTDRIRDTYVEGPADLVIEIVAPESVARDYGDKLAEYEAAGIPEYWLIDPLRQDARFYQLDDDGTYRPVPLDGNGVYSSRILPGFRLRVSWLWQGRMPTITAALAELATL
jgi:Uma2 family endonuclease